MKMPGHVWLVGAGPGDPELLTLKAARLIGAAETLVYDRLVAPDVLALAAPRARLISVGKASGHHTMPQVEINDLLVREARSGRMVVRLKGGDPFIFGRGMEEAQAVRAAGLRCDVVPGITAAQGAAIAAGVPLTHRGLATGVRFVTGHRCADGPLELDWQGLADPDTTLVVYMGAATIGEVAGGLRDAGLSADTPVLAISAATLPEQRRLVTRLSKIETAAADGGLKSPVLFIIGRVVSLAQGAMDKPCPTLAGLVAGACERAAELADA